MMSLSVGFVPMRELLVAMAMAMALVVGTRQDMVRFVSCLCLSLAVCVSGMWYIDLRIKRPGGASW